MSQAESFSSVLGPFVTRYLMLKRTLGRGYATERDVLQHLDAFLAATSSDLSPESFAHWAHSLEHLTSGVRRNRMRIVRNLCLYRRRSDPTCFLPDILQFPHPHQPIRPHIFSDTEITRLLIAASELTPTNGAPLRSQAYRLALVLLYTTGMRRGECLRLAIRDYDPRDHTLLIRESKFHKSRLLPLSQDGWREVDRYLDAEHTCHPAIPVERLLLWNRYQGGKGYTGSGFTAGMLSLFRITNIRTSSGGWPRVHDFRHSFAVHALLKWYRSGVDVQTKLPLLALYMGHVSIVSTQYYLRFIDDVVAAASDRFARHCGALVTAIPLSSGGAS
jgi:integrase